MTILVFQWFRCFVGSASCWPLAGLLLTPCWLLAGFFLASPKHPARVPARAARQSTPPEHPARASRQSTPPELPAPDHSWALGFAGLLLASSWPLPRLLLASSWRLAGLLLGSPPEHSATKSVFQNTCFSMVSVFRGVPPIWSLFLASCWRLANIYIYTCFQVNNLKLH